MAGPMIVVIASTASFFIAKENAADLVSDDYYKDGKHIDIQLHRDEEAVKRNIRATVMLSPDMDTAKVIVSGDFDVKQPLRLQLMHPAKKSDDQTVQLAYVPSETGSAQAEYNAAFKPLPKTNHWYVRVEDAAGKWRVENKWIVSQGNAVSLIPPDKLLKGQTPENPN